MNLQNEDQRGLNQHTETSHEPQRNFRVSYTRDFLLSLSELEACKKLPGGFDQSILSEFEDTPQDRYRIPGSLSSQSFRRNEYGSSPPTRGEVSNYSRVNQGRWDSRSSGRSERDSDSQSDWDLDSGRRYGNQCRRLQVPEHDGLLGSGSFPRPPGYAAGPSAPKFRANDQFQLNRSTEPYHPPRPYKAVPHSRRDASDSYNDETFGSSECMSEDRAEEERKRRASFESMRKEQQKAFQEKPKLNPEKFKDDFDITTLLEDSKDVKRHLNGSNETDEPMSQPVSNNDSDKPSFPSSAPVSRPLVPPGFSSTVVEKNIGTKSLANPRSTEVGNDLEGSLLQLKGNCALNGTSRNQEEKQYLEQMGASEQQVRSPSILGSVNNKNEKILNLSSGLDTLSKSSSMDSRFYKTSKLSETFEASENSETELDAEDMTGNKIDGESSPVHSASILEKLFGSALALNIGGSSSFIEHHDVKADDTWSPHNVQSSSKFAQWFLEEAEKKPVDLSSGRPNDLLSLIGGGEKGGSRVFDAKSTEHLQPNFSFQSSELADSHMTSNSISSIAENTKQLCNTDKSEADPLVLTCEDLEQSILSGIAENGSTLPPPVPGWRGLDAKTDQQEPDIDDRASQHLLSMLQKGIGLNDIAPSANLGIRSLDNLQNVEVANLGTGLHNSREVDAANASNSGKPLTLETLFGTAFMKELKSVGAPAPGQRGSVGHADVSVSHGLPFPLTNDPLLSSTVKNASNISRRGSGVLASNQREQLQSDRIEEHLLGYDPPNEVNSSQLQTELASKLCGFDGSVEIRLPEEDSLITVSDPLNLQNFMPARNSTKAELSSTPETPVDITETLAAVNPAFRDERPIVGGQEGPPFLRGPFDMREPDIQYRNLHLQPSSPQLHPPQLNHARPMFHPLDSHPANINMQMKFMAPDNVIHHDTPPNHQFPANILRPPFSYPSTSLAGFEPTAHNSILQQMPGNFPPPHLLRGLPRGTPVSPHPNNQGTGFMQEPNPMQGFSFGQGQPNFGGLGIPTQAPDVGGGINYPEALQRLIEMERRSNPKQIHPFATAGYSQGAYGHELDMGFGYR